MSQWSNKRAQVAKVLAQILLVSSFLTAPGFLSGFTAQALTQNAAADAAAKSLSINPQAGLPLNGANVVADPYFHVPDGHLDITFDDLSYILDQIKFGEVHSARTANTSLQPNTPTAGIVYPFDLTSKSRCLIPDDLINAGDATLGQTGLSNAYTFNNLQPWGVRQVDGQCNNITNVRDQVVPTNVYATSDGTNINSDGPGIPSNATTDHWGAADLPFIRMTPATNDPTKPLTTFDPVTGVPLYPHTNMPLSPAQIAYETPTASVSDPTPRIISQLVSDQSLDNPAALAAATYSSQNLYGADPVLENAINATSGVVTTVYDIPNVTPDFNVSAGYNSWFTLFGQFFDHGLDLVPKAGASVFIPVQGNDPLYIASPYAPNFMVLTRAADATGNSMNITTPYVDQSQTYGSHASQNFFIREYTFDGNNGGRPTATGFLLEGNDSTYANGLPTTWTTAGTQSGTLNFVTGGTNQTNFGLPTWKVMKAQALLLGIKLTDYDVPSVPVVATDQYGKFIPGANGFPMLLLHGSNGQYMWRSGTPANPVGTGNETWNADKTPAGVTFNDTPGVTWTAVSSGHPFLNDTMNSAVPFDQGGAPLQPDADSVMNSSKTSVTGFYDNENLDAHFIAGDARVNENIGLSAIHGVFHSEHNLVAQDILDFANSSDPRMTEFVKNEWLNHPQRIYQAARLVMEMEYQHMVYDEFVRRIAPNLPPFVTYNPNYNASITAEFASAVYRLGHSMLNETIARSNPGQMYDPTNNQDISLLQAFTNPAQARLVKPATVVSAVWSGTSITYTLFDPNPTPVTVAAQESVVPDVGAVVSIAYMADSTFDIENAVVEAVSGVETSHPTVTVSTKYTGGASVTPVALASANKSTHSRMATEPNTKVAYEIALMSISDPGTNGFNYTPLESAASIAQGMAAQRANEVDELVTDSVRNNLLGLPLDLASLNITRGRDTGLPTLNQFRAQYAANLPIYTSWTNYISHLRYKESGLNFVAAYGTHPSLSAPVTIGHVETATAVVVGNKLLTTFAYDSATVTAKPNLKVGDVINISGYSPSGPFNFAASDHKYAIVNSVSVDSFTVTSHYTHSPSEIVSYASVGALRAGNAPVLETGTATTESSTATVSREMTIAERRAAAQALLNRTSQDAIDFLDSVGSWKNKESGVDYIDLWAGGLAENPAKQPNLPGLLGPTFQMIFQDQTLKLQDGDRFYYLGRIVGVDLGDTIPAQKFTDIVRRNTPSRSVANPSGRGIIGLQSPGFSVSDCAFSDNPDLLNAATACPADSMSVTPLGITHDGLDNVTGFVDPVNTLGGRLVGGDGDDDLIGGPGNDRLDGGSSGGDLLAGLGGDDILIGGAGDDLLEGGPGNDVIDAGDAQVGDISDGGSGNDWLTCDNCNLIIPSQLGESGDDFIQAGRAIDTLTMGGEGNDWLEGLGGDDVQISGDDNVQGGTNFSVQITGGNDVVIGGAGFDTSFGDGGDDIFPAGDAWDQIDGNEGFDWVTYEGTTRFDNGQTILPAAFADLTLAQAPATATQTDVIHNVEGLVGSSGNDLLISGLAQDIIQPGGTGNRGDRKILLPGNVTTIVDGMYVSGAGIAPNTFVFGPPSTLISGAVNGVGGTTQTVVNLTGALTGDVAGDIDFSTQPISDTRLITNLTELTTNTPGTKIHSTSQGTLTRTLVNVCTGRGQARVCRDVERYTLTKFKYSGDARFNVGDFVTLNPPVANTYGQVASAPFYGTISNVAPGGASVRIDFAASVGAVTPTLTLPPTIDMNTSVTFRVDLGFSTYKWAGGYILAGGDGNDEVELLAGSNIVHGSYELHVCLQVKNGAYTVGADVACGTTLAGAPARGYSSMTPLNIPMVNEVIGISDVKVVRELTQTNSATSRVVSDGNVATFDVDKRFYVGDRVTIASTVPSTFDMNNALIVDSTATTVSIRLPTATANVTTNRATTITSATPHNSAATGQPVVIDYVTYTCTNSRTVICSNGFANGNTVSITGFGGTNAGFNIATAVISSLANFTRTSTGRNAVTTTGFEFRLVNPAITTTTASRGTSRAVVALVLPISDTSVIIPNGVLVLPGMVVAGVGVTAGTTVTTVVGRKVTLSKASILNAVDVTFALPVVTNAYVATIKNTDTVTEPYSSSYYDIVTAAPADITANHATSGYIITDRVNGGIDTVYDVEMIKFGCTDALTCATVNAVPLIPQSGSTNAPPQLLPRDDAALVVGTVGVPYYQDFLLIGNPLPTSVTLATGTLPPGLTMSALGAISGIPTTYGSYAISLKTTTAEGTYTTPVYTITISNLGLPSFTYGNAYASNVQVNEVFPGAVISSPGGPVAGFTITPALPLGMTLNAVTGQISGRPLVVTPLTTYVVTGSNLAGSSTANFVFEVKPTGAQARVQILAGQKRVGDTLIANTTATTGQAPFTFTYQWQWSTDTSTAAVWSNIANATDSTYVLSSTEFNQYVRVHITAVNVTGVPSSADSNYVGLILGPGVPPAMSVKITGAAYVGRSFGTDISASLYVDQSSVITYQWSTSTNSNGPFTDSPGATNTTFTPDPNFSGYIKVSVRGSSPAGFSTASDTIGPLSLLAPSAAVSVTTSTTCSTLLPDLCTYVGSVISSNAYLTQGSTPVFTYVWAATAANALKTAAYTAIRAATGATYTPVAGDLNKWVRVQVTATNALGVSTVYSVPMKVITGTQSVTPVPTISGTPSVGSTLTANPGTWDAGTVLTYQWLRNGTAIARATTATYVLVAGDVGTTISVRVTGTKVGFTTLAVTSAGLFIPGAPFISTSAPVIAGSALFGARLTTTVAAWNPVATFTYRWSRTCTGVTTLIAGQTTNAYTITATDVGCSIFVSATGARAGYNSITLSSTPTAVVTISDLTLHPMPTITGTLAVGNRVTASPGTWDTGVTLTYAWYRGATASGTVLGTAINYTLVAADLNNQITLAVTGTKVGFRTITNTFTSPTSVALGTFTTVVTPTITIPVGGLKSGSVLTAVPGTWAPTTTFTYVWSRTGGLGGTSSNIGTGSTYTLGANDVGGTIAVTTTNVLASYTPTSRTSVATAAVAP